MKPSIIRFWNDAKPTVVDWNTQGIFSDDRNFSLGIWGPPRWIIGEREKSNKLLQPTI